MRLTEFELSSYELGSSGRVDEPSSSSTNPGPLRIELTELQPLARSQGLALWAPTRFSTENRQNGGQLGRLQPRASSLVPPATPLPASPPPASPAQPRLHATALPAPPPVRARHAYNSTRDGWMWRSENRLVSRIGRLVLDGWMLDGWMLDGWMLDGWMLAGWMQDGGCWTVGCWTVGCRTVDAGRLDAGRLAASRLDA